MGELEQALQPHALVGIDTAPFIYLWERHARYFAVSEALFRHLRPPQVRGVTSMVTLIEACVYPQQQGRMDLVQAYERSLLFSEQVLLLPIDLALARHTVRLRAQYGIRVPDALQIAAALETGAQLFVTNDRRLSRVKEIEVLLLDDYVT